MAEQHGQGVAPAVGVDDVEVRVAYAARLDADERLAGAGRLELELLDRDAAGRGQDGAAIQDGSSSSMPRAPTSASVMSVSASRWVTTASTPAWPPTARP